MMEYQSTGKLTQTCLPTLTAQADKPRVAGKRQRNAPTGASLFTSNQNALFEESSRCSLKENEEQRAYNPEVLNIPLWARLIWSAEG